MRPTQVPVLSEFNKMHKRICPVRFEMIRKAKQSPYPQSVFMSAHGAHEMRFSSESNSVRYDHVPVVYHQFEKQSFRSPGHVQTVPIQNHKNIGI